MVTGYYKQVKKTRHVEAVEGVEEQGHWNVIREYPETGGKDVEWVVDVPGIPAVPAHDEEYYEQEWVEYTAEEMAQQEIEELKKYLADTDYVVIKIYEAKIGGLDTTAMETEYASVLAQRAQARARINELE